MLVYFSYPQAQEDAAQRAVYTGLGLVSAIGNLNTDLPAGDGIRFVNPGAPLAVQIGLHTGLVVVGNVGKGARQEPLALGETPHIAARLQSLAGPNELVISAATRQLLGRVFRVSDLGAQVLREDAAPTQVYRIEGEQVLESRFEAMATTGLTPLVGREEELVMLGNRWEQVTDGEGQVVLLSGEAGLGKSRLTQALCDRLADEPHQRFLYQCSPYHTNSAFYPIIAHLEHTLQLAQMPLPAAKLDRLETQLVQVGMPVAEVAPLFATLLSIASGNRYQPLSLDPQQQRIQTIAAWSELIVGWSKSEPVVCIFEDVHWSDPTSLEAIAYLIDQVHNARILLVITFRPEFMPPWGRFAHLTTHVLNRLTRRQINLLVEQTVGRQGLPAEVVEQIVTKTDGVPLYVEELTKMLLESDLFKEEGVIESRSPTQMTVAIPDTLQDSLMARLDQLNGAKGVAQLGAVLGREFTYEMIRWLSPQSEEMLATDLAQLTAAELLYQKGRPPQATYTFKHALIQDVAYSSLLRSTRQQVHQQVARLLDEQFPEIVETQPELLAHHYTEAGLAAEALTYWVQAAQRATNRSANQEAVEHVGKGSALLATLPTGLSRDRQELDLQFVLGMAYRDLKGFNATETKEAFVRAQALCERVGDEPLKLISILRGVYNYYFVSGKQKEAKEISEQLTVLANQTRDPSNILQGYTTTGANLFFRGNLLEARHFCEQSLLLYHTTQAYEHIVYVLNPKTSSLMNLSWVMWVLGYPDQARHIGHEAITFSQPLSQPFSLAVALVWVCSMRSCCGHLFAIETLIQELNDIIEQHQIAHWGYRAQFLQGKLLITKGQEESGLGLMRDALDTTRTEEARLAWTWMAAELVTAFIRIGEIEPSFALLAEAFKLVDEHDERNWEAELHRLKGELLLNQVGPNEKEAEACFHRALNIAKDQSAKSLVCLQALILGLTLQREPHFTR